MSARIRSQGMVAQAPKTYHTYRVSTEKPRKLMTVIQLKQHLINHPLSWLQMHTIRKHLVQQKTTRMQAEVTQLKKTPKGQFNSTIHGIIKHKNIRHYKCSACNVVSDSQANANAYFRNNHHPVQCTKCTKKCRMLSTLSIHMYLHGILKYPCHRCEQSFRIPQQTESA